MNVDVIELKHRMGNIDTASICDVMKNQRIICTDVKTINTNSIFGIARTVQCKNDFLTLLKALEESQAGEVLIVDGMGGELALAGELLMSEANRKGLAGVIIDGAIRDTAQVSKLNMPVYYRSISPTAGSAKMLLKTQIPVKCGGVTIYPGDLIFGDKDGVLAVSMDDLAIKIENIIALQNTEEVMLNNINSGKSLFAYLNFDRHVENIENGKDSQLEFKI
jgi:4-hydroxy-4-methyl-2-oxoglutarate aldolase